MFMDRDDDSMNKAQRLALASAVAPVLRGTSEKTKSRRVARVDAEGNVVGYTTLAEVQKALLLTRQIELETTDGVRQVEGVCTKCGRSVKLNTNIVPPIVCYEGGCAQKHCAGYEGFECSEVPGRKALLPSGIKDREGELWRCKSCNYKYYRGHTHTLVQERQNPKQLFCAGWSGVECPKLVPAYALQASFILKRAGAPWRCSPCTSKQKHNRDSALLQDSCAGYADVVCNERPGKTAFSAYNIRIRRGKPWRCMRCAAKHLYAQPETRERIEELKQTLKDAGVKGRKTMCQKTKAQRSEIAKKAWATRRATRA